MFQTLFDPDADDYRGLDWSTWLQTSETINASSWAISPSGPILHDDATNGGITVVFISGLTAGRRYTLTNRITTDATPPRTDERSILLLVGQR